MGNILTCCVRSSASPELGQRTGPVEPDCESEISVGTRHGHLPCHISDQEKPRDGALESNPADHLRASTIFLNKFHANARDQRKSNYINQESPGQLIGMYSSCSRIFLDDSTLSLPSCINMVECVTLAVYYHIKNRDANRSLAILDERRHPFTREERPEEYFEHDPEPSCIYNFLTFIFYCGSLPTECTIISLVYLERLVSYAEIDVCPANWRRILLGAILLAAKVWQCKVGWNIHFCTVLGDISLKDINELERQYLLLLKYNVNVSGGVYAKYYFDLRSLAFESNMDLGVELLTRKRAQELEAISGMVKDKDLRRAAMKRFHSSDVSFFGIGLSNAVLS